MTKELNPIDVLRTVENLVERYDALQEERDELKERAEEQENNLDDLQERVDELEEERDELKERVEGLKLVRDTLRAIASDLGTLLSAAMSDNADGMSVETFQALRTLKTTLDDLKNDERLE